MARPGKRNRKFLGTRNHGKGNAKNKRGKGGKGGWGRAGMHKHRFSYVTVHERSWMENGGHRGFHSLRDNTLPNLNLWQVQLMANKGELKKEGSGYVLDFAGKILGTGSISSPIVIRAMGASESAKERIAAAGGKFELIAPKERKETGGIKKDNRGRLQGEGKPAAEGAKPAAKAAPAAKAEPAAKAAQVAKSAPATTAKKE